MSEWDSVEYHGERGFQMVKFFILKVLLKYLKIKFIMPKFGTSRTEFDKKKTPALSTIYTEISEYDNCST